MEYSDRRKLSFGCNKPKCFLEIPCGENEPSENVKESSPPRVHFLPIQMHTVMKIFLAMLLLLILIEDKPFFHYFDVLFKIASTSNLLK